MSGRNLQDGESIQTKERLSSKRLAPYRLLTHIVWGTGGVRHFSGMRATLRIGRLKQMFECPYSRIWDQLRWLEEQGYLEILATGRGTANIRLKDMRLEK